MTQLAFYFDSSACSGCKACQAACKDKHNLPVGLLWRHVYEVTGGGWTRSGEAWLSDVFAYNLSISCNHCERPICVEVCPTQAMQKRVDGIVVVDQAKCVGCQYCSWACPYDAPQYDRAHGHMTKCDFCADNLAAGLPPACVAACPMRVLDVREKQDASASVKPLPAESLTQPALMIKPHQAAQRESTLANVEEVSVPHTSERSLIAFTLLAQMAVGATWFLSFMQPHSRAALAVIALIMLGGLLASFLHLGTPLNAWRSIRNLRTSWLSREVLCAALFTVSLGGVLITGGIGIWLADAIGLALIVSMAQVYRLRTMPAWNRRPTMVSFFVTTLLLGSVLCGALITAGPVLALGPISLIGLRQLIERGEARTILLLRGAAIIALLMTLFSPIGWWESLPLVLIAEVLARQQFYATRKPRSMWRFAAQSPNHMD
jgi:anaerobic dimethyl sulfoxide reductase subunit B (iron-sulfur subunit)